MCGRYVLYSGEKIYEHFEVVNHSEKLTENYNVSPGQYAPVITRSEDGNTVLLMRWGLVPHWAKDDIIGYRMINARAETINQKPSFKTAFEKRRCLVPANGFYEWKKEGNKKTPYYFKNDQEIFSFAGLFENWIDKDGKSLNTFTIITTQPNGLMSNYHDRMPLILSSEWERKWLDEGLVDIPDTSPKLAVYEVSDLVNNPQNNGPELILPIS